MGIFTNKKKGKNRVKVIQTLMEMLKSEDDIYTIIDYRNASEAKIKQFMYYPLIRSLSIILKDNGYKKDAVNKAKRVFYGKETSKRP